MLTTSPRPALLAAASCVAALTILQISTPAAADSAAAPGCGTALAHSPDGHVVTVSYSDAIVSVDDEMRRQPLVTHCSTTITFPAVPGHRVAVSKIDNRGYVDLPADARALVLTSSTMGRTWAWWNSNTFAHSPQGPTQGHLNATHQVPRSSLRWGPCGRPATVTLRTTLLVNVPKTASEPSAYLSLDSTDLSTESIAGTRVSLLRQPCSR